MTSNLFTKAALFFGISMLGFGTLDAQKNETYLQRVMHDKQYVFIPQSFTSPTIIMPTLIWQYDVKVTPDSIIAILPFFGRTFSAQFGGSQDEGLRFTSTDFKYSSVEKKKGKWEVTIKTKDAKGVQLFMVIFDNGEANMEVISPGREAMFFKGYIKVSESYSFQKKGPIV
jgi:hypothetical protein